MVTPVKRAEQLRQIAEQSLEDAKKAVKAEAKDISDKIFDMASKLAAAGKFEIKILLEATNSNFGRTLLGYPIGSIDGGGMEFTPNALWGYVKFELEADGFTVDGIFSDEIRVSWEQNQGIAK